MLFMKSFVLFFVRRIQLKRGEWETYTTDMTKESRQNIRNSANILLPGSQ